VLPRGGLRLTANKMTAAPSNPAAGSGTGVAATVYMKAWFGVFCWSNTRSPSGITAR
jgi:hypothetical protein